MVTVVANYLTTQLPAQMRVNDANHALTVENQVSRLAGSLRALAADALVGSVLTQPVSLGSMGAPPFAGSDGSVIGPGASGSSLGVSFTVTGGATYAPPVVGPAGGAHYGSCSTQSSTALTCSASSKVVWNFSAGGPTSFSMTTSGGPYYVNTSASNSTLGVTASSSLTLYLLVVGSNDTVTLTMSASGNAVHIIMVGDHDTVSVASGSLSSTTLTVYFVGRYDLLSSSSLSASNSKIFVTAFGSYDNTSFGTVSASNSFFNVYLNGFTPSSPAATCPIGNLAYTTDSVSVGTHSGGTYNVTFNDTTVTSGSAPSPWTPTFGTPSISCPFYGTVTMPFKPSGVVGASLVVDLKNTYAPQALVAFDQGAVLYAQPSGLPVMLVGPALNLSGGRLSLWIPEFVNSVGTRVGVGTAELSVRLVGLLNLSLPASGFSVSGVTSIAVTTPFAAAWTTFLNAPGSSLAGDAVCAPARSTACSGPFALNGPLGTVYLNVTASALALEVATYSVTLG